MALGFECPLFVPVPRDPQKLTSARAGEGNRPWSAGAGAAVLATGLTEVVWLLRAIREQAGATEGFLDWGAFSRQQHGVLFWEAFVSSTAKGSDHRADARVAVELFAARSSSGAPETDVSCESAYSLIGAAMLATGWTRDLGVLGQPCIVMRAQLGA